MSIEDVADRVDRCLAARPYCPCVLLVHADVRSLQAAVQQLAERKGWAELAVSQVLASSLTGLVYAVPAHTHYRVWPAPAWCRLYHTSMVMPPSRMVIWKRPCSCAVPAPFATWKGNTVGDNCNGRCSRIVRLVRK